MRRSLATVLGPVLLLLGGACALPNAPGSDLLTRAGWGARPPVLPMTPHEIRAITIHHTATRQQPDRPLAEKMRALQDFSQSEAPLADGRTKAAWADIPYHLYVDPAGRVAEGRPLQHAGDTNTSYDPTGHLLIVLEGNFEEERPTAAQMATLRTLVRQHARRFAVPADRIGGHKDHARTLCPGVHLYARLPELRQLVARR